MRMIGIAVFVLVAAGCKAEKAAQEVRVAAHEMSAGVRDASNNLARATDNIDPLASKMIMTELLQRIAAGDSLAEALRKAQSRADSLMRLNPPSFRLTLWSEEVTCTLRIGPHVLITTQGNDTASVVLESSSFQAYGLAPGSLAWVKPQCEVEGREPNVWVAHFRVYSFTPSGVLNQISSQRRRIVPDRQPFDSVAIFVPTYAVVASNAAKGLGSDSAAK